MKKDLQEIYSLFASIKTPQRAKIFLEDMFTPAELEQLIQRWRLVKMLHQGVPQRDISKKLRISISKVTRGSRVLKTSGKGFKLFLENAN